MLVAALIRAESNFWTWARSRKDARGLMQLTPQTGRWVASQTGFAGFDDDVLYDPAANLELGCWYLAHLLAEYRGSLPATLAAWNGGRTNVDLWLSNGTWSGKIEDSGSIPFRETRDFVRRVLDNLTWYERLYGG
jgi:soluble lytic murein transglycosylase